MAKALTSKSVEAFKPDPKRRQEIADPALSGLYLVIQPTGVKSWALRYRFAGKPAKLTLGRFPIMGLAEARKAATAALQDVEHGHDPSTAKKVAKAEQIAKLDIEKDTFGRVLDNYDRRHLSRLKSGKSARWFLDKHVAPKWGKRDVREITRRDVIDLLDGIMDSGKATTANRVRLYVSGFFSWCVEREIVALSPVAGTKPPAKEISRSRVLTDDEVRWFWLACDHVGEPWGPLGKMLLLTGQRLTEVAEMTDAETVKDVWHLAAHRTKNGRAHDVHLSDAARAVLDSKARINSKAGYIFTTTGNTPVQGFGKARKKLTEKMAGIAAKERGEPVQIAQWGFHDLRRTVATGMARMGIQVRVTEAVLNHVSGTAAGIVSVYQRHDYADEKKAALDAWARHVTHIVDGSPDNVVLIQGARL